MSTTRPYWIFYPLYGLKITPDDSPIDHSLIFDDATIISPEEFDKVFQHIATEEQREKKAKGVKTELEWDLGMVASCDGYEADSIIIIRADRTAGNTVEDIRKKADQRLQEVVSAISNMLLMYSDFNWTCCLADEFYSIPQIETVMVHESRGRQQTIYRAATRSFIFHTPRPPFEINRTELLKKAQDSRFQAFSSYLLTTIPGKSSSNNQTREREKIAKASISLYRAVHSNTPEHQLIGAVTAMGVLLKVSDQEKFEISQEDLKPIVGDYAYEFFGGDLIFDTRDAYIYQGEPVAKEYAYIAICLATHLLILYSTLSCDPPHSPYISTKKNEILKKWAHSPDIVDPLPFFISNYALQTKSFEGQTETDGGTDGETDRMQYFAKYVSVFAKFRDLDMSTAFEILRATCINHRSVPFKSVDDFNAFWSDNYNQIEPKAKEAFVNLRDSEWIWGVKRYKWDKNVEDANIDSSIDANIDSSTHDEVIKAIAESMNSQNHDVFKNLRVNPQYQYEVSPGKNFPDIIIAEKDSTAIQSIIEVVISPAQINEELVNRWVKFSKEIHATFYILAPPNTKKKLLKLSKTAGITARIGTYAFDEITNISISL